MVCLTVSELSLFGRTWSLCGLKGYLARLRGHSTNLLVWRSFRWVHGTRSTIDNDSWSRDNLKGCFCYLKRRNIIKKFVRHILWQAFMHITIVFFGLLTSSLPQRDVIDVSFSGNLLREHLEKSRIKFWNVSLSFFLLQSPTSWNTSW